MKHFNRLLALAAGLALATPALAAPHPNWTATIAHKPNGAHTLGNPAAKVKVTEFVSYTCPHCAHFNREADAILRLTYIPQGKVAVTVHHLIRDPVDLTVAMLTNCGDERMFFKRHNTFFALQDKWLGKVGTASAEQKARWERGKISDRVRAIATDLGFYQTMEQWGFSRVATDRCLADAAMAKRLVDQTEEASKLGVDSTPSFAIDGQVLVGTHDWETLDSQIKARL